MQTRLNVTTNGIELQLSDLNAVAQAAAQADDYTLGELFRLEPLGYVQGGTYAKAILPWALRNTFGEATGGITGHATVAPAGGTGAVAILPFRAMVGTRSAVGAAPANQLNWQDVRSQVYVGTSVSGNFTQLGLAANASGNPRWDLVYCAMTVDGATSNVTRFVKNPTTKVVSQQSLSVSLATTTSVAAVTGTPGASPALPSLPADAGGVYYIPLAYVWVPNGFNASSTVSLSNIRDASPVATIARSTGAARLRPASGNNDGAGTYATDSTFQWNTLSGVRPDVFLPPAMIGCEMLFIEADLTVAHPSHANGSVIDDSTDWRNRFFLTFSQINNGTNKFGNDTTSSSGTNTVPGAALTTPTLEMGNSCQYDTAYNGPNSATVVSLGMTGTFAVYVDANDGKLKAYNASAVGHCFIWIMASAPFPNR